MPRRIVLHAGFHKTGTSTIQATLRENRKALKKHVALRLRGQMKDLIHATRGYSTWRDPITLTKAQLRFEALLAGLHGMPRRTLVISAEELAGHLPGRGDLADYSAAPILLYTFWQSAKAAYPDTEFLVYLSTRDPDAWLPSAYWEHVKASSMTLSYDAFVERYAGAADLDDMVSQITSRMPCPVHHARLEACQDSPLGPADPLLNLCDIPPNLRSDLIPVHSANARQGDDVLAALIEANRTIEDREKRKVAKQAILSKAEQT
ncbi:hypothetical protein C1J03_02615 [Sulfitobacter sp. SK012]|uniref:hypothetical protein n=1 Tax=Sulfitobacter sp. SK012 TaxID=1389005 RepID=UPI000E0BF608|nr:hypothetical protein [Sulfitobacter sp. SK012]AXI45021.1 hypothetical protein C1J03_02615 [Sulfitobacter sp. SK012]